jgi:hypothetical protein
MVIDDLPLWPNFATEAAQFRGWQRFSLSLALRTFLLS